MHEYGFSAEGFCAVAGVKPLEAPAQAGRPVGVILGHNTSMNPFAFRPSYRALEALPAVERWARLRDPEIRAAILAEPPSEAELNRQGQFIRFVATRWDRMFHQIH